MLKKVNAYHNYRGSNDMWRNALSKKGTVTEIEAYQGGTLKPGTWLFTIKYDGKENKELYTDGINAAHVGIYVGNGRVVHSTTGGVQRDVITSKRWTHAGECKLLDYSEGNLTDIDINRGAYPYITTYDKNLTNDEMKQNATYFKGVMQSRGWSINAIAAAFGNWQSECRLNTNNPERDTYPQPGSYGFGLPQWTPWYRRYGMWCKENNIQNIANDNNPAADINKQLDYHDYECKYGDVHNPDKPGGATWYSYQRGDIRYSYSWSRFKIATDDVAYMARAYYWQYERSGGGTDESADRRAKQAVEWYKYLSGSTPEPPTPGQDGDFLQLSVYSVAFTSLSNIININTDSGFVFYIYAKVRKKGDTIKLTFDINDLSAAIMKINGSSATSIDSVDYPTLPTPRDVYIEKSTSFSNLSVVNNGNSFEITGVINNDSSEFEPAILTSFIYDGSIVYNNKTLSTRGDRTYLNIVFTTVKKKSKSYIYALRRRYPIYG